MPGFIEEELQGEDHAYNHSNLNSKGSKKPLRVSNNQKSLFASK